ncbi:MULTISPECIES: hypothetical protein [unclassified Janthinobacterium]|uniref:hypothetical protein n=1 Tax=unclassified Janthinobacterium TaxID=2610881 RepID=UPI00160846A4|nr:MULTISPECIES: hypothetical protein [unclassified Janthinobacterium]MBB5610588.1 F0F1-type ATP synthase membrane subunit b/b' [Janthinobacterium sp. S3T4]MBB5615958.1 F0F1-type ATP synthase membrane subunit b/b' [Janthinobacterium sp. S3M3]
MIDVKKLMKEATKEVGEERRTKAKNALVAALRRRESALQVVRNCEAEITDLQASIEDGSFN